MANDHLKISETEAWDQQKRVREEQLRLNYIRPAPTNYFKWVWFVSCMLIVILNCVISIIAIRDMFINTYAPTNHYFMTAAFTFTIGILAIVDAYIIKEK